MDRYICSRCGRSNFAVESTCRSCGSPAPPPGERVATVHPEPTSTSTSTSGNLNHLLFVLAVLVGIGGGYAGFRQANADSSGSEHWIRFNSPKCDFSVMMPSEPNEVSKIEGKDLPPNTTAHVLTNPFIGEFVVMVTALPGQHIPANLSYKLFDEMGKTITMRKLSERPISLDSTPGREFIYELPTHPLYGELKGVHRIYLVDAPDGSVIYQTISSCPTGSGAEKSPELFHRTFALRPVRASGRFHAEVDPCQ